MSSKSGDKSLEKQKKEEAKRKLLEAYVELVKYKNLIPTRADLASIGISRDKLRHYFTNLSGIRKDAKAFYPEAFKGIVDTERLLSDKNVAELKKRISRYKRFFITTAVAGQRVNADFLQSIELFCKKNNALLLILPSHDPAHNLQNEVEWHFDDILSDKDFVFCSLDLNSNIHISDLRVTAKQVNPTTGLGRVCQGKGSFIFASPKQSLEYDPVSNIKMPHARMSTGACTVGNYNTTKGNSLRTAFLAENDHEVGGIIVEIVDNSLYHFRQVQSDIDGSFADLGTLYSGHKTKKIVPKFVMGDLHAGEHDETAVSAWKEVINHTKCDEVFFHDFFNGASISHYLDEDIITRAQQSAKDKLSLKKEIVVSGEVMSDILELKSLKKGVIVKSNHDEWLLRWLQGAKFKDDPLNFQVGCQLATVAVEKIDPLKFAVELYCKNIPHLNKLLWLERDQDYKVGGVECGSHGDVGQNGSRGSKISMERGYGRCIVGHSHTPGKLRKVFQVGTTSKLKLNYTKGTSSWVHCSALVYPNGQVQLINSIEGKWRLVD